MFISFPIFLSTIRAAAAVHLCFCPTDANGSTLAAALMDFLLVCTIYIILSRPGGFLVYICLMVWMRIVPKIIQKKGKVDFFLFKMGQLRVGLLLFCQGFFLNKPEKG
jgi:hypothetical protein